MRMKERGINSDSAIFFRLRELEESNLRPMFWRHLLCHLTKLPLTAIMQSVLLP